MHQSTKSALPRKPHRDFPLFAHQVGQWAKKVKGKTHYFGVWADPDKALDRWLEQKDDLLAGRTPRAKGDGLTMRELANRFLTSKQRILNSGEIKQRTWDELHATCERLVASFGKDRLVTDLAADDFELLRARITKTWGPVRTGNEVQRVRSVFKYGYESGLILNPIRFGPSFKRASKKVLRKLRAANGPRLFSREEIHKMMGAASVQVRAMILLGINAGYGNEDVASLPIGAVDLVGGWVRFARPKTGIDRRCKLWKETVAALNEVLAERGKPTDEANANILFVTKYGRPWKNGAKGATALTFEIRKLLKAMGLKRPGLNFYALRHTFRTVADGCRDQPAIDFIMGHAPREDDMAAVYRESIDNERLQTVAEHVRTWLFAKPAKAGKTKARGQ